jgi:hypothetical protein
MQQRQTDPTSRWRIERHVRGGGSVPHYEAFSPFCFDNIIEKLQVVNAFSLTFVTLAASSEGGRIGESTDNDWQKTNELLLWHKRFRFVFRLIRKTQYLSLCQ